MGTSKSSTGTSSRPKALLFDIGGVCVVSPMQAILDYEKSQRVPPGWVNFSISASKPNGAWQRLERGEIALDGGFFEAFTADLSRPDLWKRFLQQRRARRKTDEKESENRGGRDDDDDDVSVPPVPSLDTKWMFWEMMRISREPDPAMFPALKKLKRSGEFVIAALSNTVVFPEGHPYNVRPADPADDVRAQFDVFVSSAHVGLRKPDPSIYRLALDWMREAWAERNGDGEGELRPEDVLFLDDIGENLKAAGQLGFRTIKVHLGNTRAAVQELERATGLSLLEKAASTKL